MSNNDDYMDLFADVDLDKSAKSIADEEVIAPPPMSYGQKANSMPQFVPAINAEEPTAQADDDGIASQNPHAAAQTATEPEQVPVSEPEQEAKEEPIQPMVNTDVYAAPEEEHPEEGTFSRNTMMSTEDVLSARELAAAKHIADYEKIVQEENKALRRNVLLQVNPDDSLGTNLTNMRNLVGLTIDDVSQRIMLRKDYINSLEHDSLQLPYVYISAYVRSLANLYGVPKEQTEALMELLHKLLDDKEIIADTLIQNVKEGELVDENEERRVKNLFILIGVSAVVILGLIIWGIVALCCASGPDAPAPTTITDSQPISGQTQPLDPTQTDPGQELTVTESTLETLIPPEIPQASVLQRSKRPSIRK